MKKLSLVVALSTVLAAAPVVAQTVVTVNNTRIDSAQVDQQVQVIVAQSNGQVKDSAELRQNITRRLVTRELMIQEAKRLKLEQTPEYKQIIERARAEVRSSGEDRKPGFAEDWKTFEGNVLAQALVARVVAANPVTDAQVQEAYNQLVARYRNTQEVRLGEIITQNRADAEAAINALKRGERFVDVAKRYTIDPQGKANGGINPSYTSLKDLEEAAPEVFNAVKSLRNGRFTETPVQGNGIYAVFLVQDKRSVTIPSLEQMKPQLQQDLQNLVVEREIARLYQQANIR